MLLLLKKMVENKKRFFLKKEAVFFMGDLDLVFASFLYGYGVLSILRTIIV